MMWEADTFGSTPDIDAACVVCVCMYRRIDRARRRLL